MEHQEKDTYSLGYNLPLTKSNDNPVLNGVGGVSNAKVVLFVISRYVQQYATNIEQQAIISKFNLNRAPTELHYIKISVFTGEANTQRLWTPELGSPEGIIVPIWIVLGFQQGNLLDSKELNHDTFYTPLHIA